MKKCSGCGALLEYQTEAGAFSQQVLVEIPGVYDGGLFWECPACEYRWHRWPEGSELREKTRPWVERS